MQRPMERIYADTSVFGGVFEPQHKAHSRRFFDKAAAGHYELYVSRLVVREIRPAPEAVRELFASVSGFATEVEISDPAIDLQSRFLDSGILGARWADDALHVALATVVGCTRIVSWNFRHIANYRKIPLFNAVSVLCGYNPIEISTPLEVIGDEE